MPGVLITSADWVPAFAGKVNLPNKSLGSAAAC